MLRMPIPWFDESCNQPGHLSVRLATDCKKLNTLTTSLIGFSIQNIVLLITSLTIGFIFEWRLALITLGLMPLIISTGLINMKQG